MASGTRTDCLEVFKRLKSAGKDPEHFWLDECQPAIDSNSDDSWTHEMDELPTDVLTIEQFKQALESHPHLKFYLYSGMKDYYVPADNFTDELNSVGSLIDYKNFSGTGHDGYLTEPLVWENLKL